MGSNRRRAASDRDDIVSYVVRVYRSELRRGTNCPGTLIGLVQDVRHGEPRAFHSMSELWTLLGLGADRGAPAASTSKSGSRSKSP